MNDDVEIDYDYGTIMSKLVHSGGYNVNSLVNITPINNSTTIKKDNILQIDYGTIKIGNLEMEVEQLEICLRYLLNITKDAQPENFI